MKDCKGAHRRERIEKLLFGVFLLFIFIIFFKPEEKNWRAAGNGETATQAKKEMFFTLTKEEEDYLAKLRDTPLFLGVCEAGIWEEQGGVNYGLATPLLDVLRYEFGLKIEIVRGTWKKNTTALRAGELDFLIGVPAGLQVEAKESDKKNFTENILYFSEWLYQKPYTLVEYLGGRHSAKDSDKQETVIAYVAKNPVSESILPYLSDIFNAQDISAKNIDFLPCKNESAVFKALKNGSAAVGLLPKDALLSRYPETDFSVIVNLSQYGDGAALGTAKKELSPLLEILNRYLDTTQEGDILREAIRMQQQNARQEQIGKQEEEIIKNLQARGKKLFYAQAGLDAMPFYWHDKSGAHGVLSDFLRFVEEKTGLVFKEDFRSGEEALQALEDGEILFIAGMGDFVYCPVICMDQYLVPVVSAKELKEFSGAADTGQNGQIAIARRYWGVAQEFMPLLAGTAFDGHTVEFPDEQSLYQAMQKGEIGGMLILQESLDALLFSGEYSYAALEEISFPIKSGLAFSNSDADAAALFSRLWQFYELFYGERETAVQQYRTKYREMAEEQKKLVLVIHILGAMILIFAAALLFSVHFNKHRKKKTERKL